ncbi:class I SAM-dependent methyltransferase [Ignatzschineria sp. LJL83]
MTNTKNYYNEQALEFVENTFKVDMTNVYQPFLKEIPHTGRILDIGCGSGRDSLYFKDLGFHIEAFDYSENLVALAKEKTGLDIQHRSFYDLEDIEKYEGIWACASLLHCERSRLEEVIQKIIQALKINGVCYLSFKYGNQDRIKDGRSFTDLNEQQADKIFTSFKNIQQIKQWITTDNRPDREESWLNIIIKRIA